MKATTTVDATGGVNKSRGGDQTPESVESQAVSVDPGANGASGGGGGGGGKSKNGKKKKRSALANASNPHHLRNYVPSRLAALCFRGGRCAGRRHEREHECEQHDLAVADAVPFERDPAAPSRTRGEEGAGSDCRPACAADLPRGGVDLLVLRVRPVLRRGCGVPACGAQSEEDPEAQEAREGARGGGGERGQLLR